MKNKFIITYLIKGEITKQFQLELKRMLQEHFNTEHVLTIMDINFEKSELIIKERYGKE